MMTCKVLVYGSGLRSRPAIVLGAAVIGCASGGPPTGTDPVPRATVRHEMLVSPDSLARQLPGVVVLHVARARAEYDRARIPEARFLPLGALLVERDGLPNELPDVAVLDSVFTSTGVTDDARIVLYGEPLAAARAFFTLDVLGHGDHVALLDGGLEAWRARGHPIAEGTAADPAATRGGAGSFTPRYAAERLVDAAWVSAHASDPSFALIDARPSEEFSGERPGEGVVRPGHIPGARSLFWRRALVSDSQPRLKDATALRALFAAAGAERGDTVITYCRTGVQSSHAYFVARYLGFEVRMYDGSYLDWNREASRPVERGR
jgi:thiosulfate/3-mercaptopyruvate sulfurtransferase